MRTAPIQIRGLSFKRISVELDDKYFADDGDRPANVASDFGGVTINTYFGESPVEKTDDDGHQCFVTLRVKVDNAATDKEDGAYSPYLLDIEAGATMIAVPGAEALDDVRDLLVVNGTSLLWSAIREQVSNLTARMPAGSVTLPTVNFGDLRKQADAPPKKKPASKPRKRKTPADKPSKD